jgi:hypothetical protein
MTFLHERSNLGCQKSSDSSSDDIKLTFGMFLRDHRPLLRMNAPGIEEQSENTRMFGMRHYCTTQKLGDDKHHDLLAESLRAGDYAPTKRE